MAENDVSRSPSKATLQTGLEGDLDGVESRAPLHRSGAEDRLVTQTQSMPGSPIVTVGAAVTDSGAREAFLAATFELHRYPDQDLRLFEGLALLRLAPGPFRKIELDCLAGIERAVTVAEQILQPSKQHGSPPESNGHPPSANGMVADALLPQLTQLQDRAMMCASLAGALGEPVIVTGIDVVRHKPGRRAVLRYDIDRRGSREIFYGKTFASELDLGVQQVTAQIASARSGHPCFTE